MSFISQSYRQMLILASIPFIFFMAGYYGMALLVRQDPFPAPSLVGKNLTEAVMLLSQDQLNARVLSIQENSDIPSGTVLSQVPRAGQKIKQHQPVFLVVSRAPEKGSAPEFRGQRVAQVQERARELGIRLKLYQLESAEPKEMILGQWPLPGNVLHNKSIILYVSRGSLTPSRLVPDFVGLPIADVVGWLKPQGVKAELLLDPGASEQQGRVIAQKPLAGSLVNINKLPQIQLHVTRE